MTRGDSNVSVHGGVTIEPERESVPIEQDIDWIVMTD